jgi:molybdopterin converting factor subunit 1
MKTTKRGIDIRLFAQARELTGRDRVTLAADGHLTALAVRRLLGSAHPELAGLLARSALAVNHSFARDDDVVMPGDEVALIPPVAGG